MTYRVRLIEGLSPCYVVEEVTKKGEAPVPLVTVDLPAFRDTREKVQAQRHQLAEAICRMLNGALPL